MKNILVVVCCLLAVTQARTIKRNDLLKPRVVNGENAQLGDRPFQVSLQVKRQHFCGGSIINEHWVVTAAHCAYGKAARNVIVVSGTVDLLEPFSIHQVEQIIVHEHYNRIDSYWNDIALIKVINPFEFSFRTQPVSLPKAHVVVKTNSSVIVSGWGETFDTASPNILQKTEVFIADQEYCRTVARDKQMNVYPTNICANNPTWKTGECYGDSGGPLTVNGVLEGIVSWSIKDPDCGSTKYPGVHTRVSEYVDWIRKNAT